MSEALIRNHSSKVVVPQEFEQFLGTLSFLGSITSSHSRLAAGKYEEIVLTYEVGASGLADSGRLKITFKFYSDWGEFQTSDPQGANYVTAVFRPRASFPGESDATVQRLNVKYDHKGHERPYQKTILVDVMDGYVRPGDRIEVRLGDRSKGGPGTRVQTFVEDTFKFRAYVDVTGTSRLAAVPGDLVLTIHPAEPDQLKLLTPRLAGEGVPVSVLARLDDAWGNPCLFSGGKVFFKVFLDKKIVVETEVVWVAEDKAVRTELNLAQSGNYRVEASIEGKKPFKASVPLTINNELVGPRAYFADLHVHSHDTVGTNSTQSNLRFARDWAALDILGYTVNDFQVTDEDWNSAVSDVEKFNQEERFVCFAGTEWCGNSSVGGDHNVVFLENDIRFPCDAQNKTLRSFEWHEQMKSAAPVPGRWPLSQLYQAYEDYPEKFLLIPHVGGRRASLDWHHSELERLIEVASSWGHFDWLFQEALAKGYKLGASASGDEHRGRPGGGAPGASIFGVHGGLTGIISGSLNRPEIAHALRARHTWATTGERNVALLSSGIHTQGDEIPHQETVPLRYRLLGHSGWEYAAIKDPHGVVWERNIHQELGFDQNRFRVRWGGARVKDRYRWANWKLDIRVENASVLEWEKRGFEHLEEKVTREEKGFLKVESSTHGDADGIDFLLDSLSDSVVSISGEIHGFDGTRFGKPIAISIQGSEILKKEKNYFDLGGVDLFIVLERITSKELPLDLEGEINLPVKRGELKSYPLYLFAREAGDAKVWTSPLFIG